MINIHTTIKVCTYTHYDEMKGGAKRKIGVVWRG